MKILIKQKQKHFIPSKLILERYIINYNAFSSITTEDNDHK